MHGLPITAPVSQVLSLFQQYLHQGTANTGVAVSIDSVGEPRTGNADLGGVAALYYAVVSLNPFLHCFHGTPQVRLYYPWSVGIVNRRSGAQIGAHLCEVMCRSLAVTAGLN